MTAGARASLCSSRLNYGAGGGNRGAGGAGWPGLCSQAHACQATASLCSWFPSSHAGKGIIGPILQMRKLRGKEVIKVVPNLQLGGDRVGV